MCVCSLVLPARCADDVVCGVHGRFVGCVLEGFVFLPVLRVEGSVVRLLLLCGGIPAGVLAFPAFLHCQS